ncbi:GGDEF-domain containing protein [Lysobacter helvus]|uniref:GGDEF-domain containing protein n=2 Tax=Lysobacteraceae TaxID=32033 RepID=A0ABM7Q1P0_9GAMM|nr:MULTISPECIES: EAL domain-containing protein [Lysobacter]BCT91119.1 GGDEF-domain containing protein [Lysobacter caseinilyticus]BCT94272.1 GGDEF-domain containing protein [Lysobacter helvus]
MRVKQDSVLRLLIVDDSVEAAEAIASGLRNAGIAVRAARPESEAELPALLGGALDIAIVAREAKSPTLAAVMQALDASGKDVPVLMVVDTVDDTTLLQAQERGVRGLVLRGRAPHLLGTVRAEWADLEARRAQRLLEAQVRETERRCDALIESSRDPIAYVHEGMHIRANAAYLEMFGFDDFEDLEGMSLLDLVASKDVADFKTLLKKLSKGETPPPRYELEARDQEGNSFPAVMEFTPAFYEGEPCVQIVFRRQETDPELAREVEELRQRDQATGLLNRATFLQTLETAVAGTAQSGAHHALLLVEPDHFVKLLQEIGLAAADDLIAALADRLRSALRDDDVAARFGEHQFAVLSRNSDHQSTVELAERMRSAFADHVFAVGERSLSATVSIGGVQIGEKIASVTQVLAKASQGVQSSVGVGGNRADIFDPGAVDRAEEERMRAWVERIRTAVDGDGFVLHYQPVISLHGDEGETYESLLRLRGANEGELVPPQMFLPIAEEHGLLWEIDRWVVGRAIQVIAERARLRKETTMLVKITQASLQDDTLARYIGEQLAVHKVPGSRLVLQLPESKVFTHLKQAQAFRAAVAAFGTRVGLEQFGTGLNSFQLMQHFEPALVKIDRAFIQDLASNPENQAKIREMSARVAETGAQTIAEFVQDAGSMTFLFSSGVDFVQGHFLAAAGPEMDYEFQ